MLYDASKLAKKRLDKRLSREYMDIVYDIESYVIDMTGDDSRTSPSKQARRGAELVALDVYDEYERKNVCFHVGAILSSLGVPQSIKGFRILEECVLVSARLVKKGLPYHMSEVYKEVSERFGINAHNAERLCRYACDYVNPSRNAICAYPFLEQLTHRTVENVTVKELVDVLVRYVITKCRFVTVEK